MTAEHASGRHMEAEIWEQPAVLDRILTNTAQIIEVAARVRELRPRMVLVAGRGTSDHAALYAKYLVETMTGLPAGLVSPSTLTLYESQPQFDQVLWICISQSGSSPDLIESTSAASRAGALTLAITNTLSSPLAQAADHHIDLQAGPETAVAATKSYTSQLLTTWTLITAWTGRRHEAASSIPQLASRLLDQQDVHSVVERLRHVDNAVITSRGFSYCTAREAALKLMETSYLPTLAFSAADLLHGPIAMLEAGAAALVVLPVGRPRQMMEHVLAALRDREVNPIIVGCRSGRAETDPHITVPTAPSDELQPILDIIPFQRVALSLALAKGSNPDAPRNLQKITHTR
jgi:glucosamine--fructose-6-phosphate aminotransferase (isomerizing)